MLWNDVRKRKGLGLGFSLSRLERGGKLAPECRDVQGPMKTNLYRVEVMMYSEDEVLF
jgi:hypothetical protein